MAGDNYNSHRLAVINIDAGTSAEDVRNSYYAYKALGVGLLLLLVGITGKSSTRYRFAKHKFFRPLVTVLGILLIFLFVREKFSYLFDEYFNSTPTDEWSVLTDQDCTPLSGFLTGRAKTPEDIMKIYNCTEDSQQETTKFDDQNCRKAASLEDIGKLRNKQMTRAQFLTNINVKPSQKPLAR